MVFTMAMVLIGDSSLLWAQAIRFEHLTARNGLASNRVYAVLQDKDGFLWFGTAEGLNRYDGYRLKTYRHNPADPQTLSDNLVWCMVQDDERLWIGTNRGLNHLDTRTGVFTTYMHDPAQLNSLSHDTVRSLYRDRSGTLWVGTDNGLNRFDPQSRSFVRFNYHPASPANPAVTTTGGVLAIVEDTDGMIWFGVFDDGLYRLDPETGETQHFEHRPGNAQTLPDNRILALHEDRQGTLWVGTWKGLTAFDRQTYRAHTPHLQNIPDPMIITLFEDEDRTLWIGTLKGLAQFTPATNNVTAFVHEPNAPLTLGGEEVRAVFRDATGVYWVATRGGGISRFTLAKHITHYQYNPNHSFSLPSNNVRQLYESRDHKIWISTDGGLTMYDPETDQLVPHFLASQVPASSYIQTFFEDEKGVVWLGSFNGLFKVENNRTHHFFVGPNGLSHSAVVDILSDSLGNLWLATNGGGIDKLIATTGTISHYQPAPGQLLDGVIFDLEWDVNGTLWAATRKGLHSYVREKDAFEHWPLSLTQTSPQPVVTKLLADPNGGLWIGTFTGELLFFQPESSVLHQYTERHGLPGGVVLSLGWKQSSLLVQTTRGVALLDSTTNAFRRFRLNAALETYDLRTMILSRDGHVYLGSYNGFAFFHPDTLDNVRVPAPTVLTDFRVLNEPSRSQLIGSTAAVTLPHNRNFVEFEFATLDFTDPTRNQYQYQLVDLDPDWVYADNRTHAAYPDLKPGEYVFRVKGANSQGIWDETGTAIQLTITPPFWETWWFRLLGLGVMATILYTIYQYRIQQLLKLERTRKRIADDLHDDIGSKMSSIALMLYAAGQDDALNTPQRLNLHHISDIVRKVVDDLRDTVWIVDSGRDSLEQLVARMKTVSRTMLSNCEYELHTPEAVPNILLDMEFRRNLLLLYKEALHNAIRHANATRITIHIKCDAELFSFTIRDNGSGFDTQQVKSGRGSQTLQTRANLIRGKLDTESQLGWGTTVRFLISISQIKNERKR